MRPSFPGFSANNGIRDDQIALSKLVEPYLGTSEQE